MWDHAGPGAAQQIRVADVGIGVVEGKGTAALEIGAGAKGLVSRSGENDGANLVILALTRFRDGFRQAADHLSVQGVSSLGTIEGQPKRLAFHFFY
jgi:hypothetical protein